MIVEYHRPKRIDEALELLSRTDTPTYPLAGGTHLNQPTSKRINVVDLQDLGLDSLKYSGNNLSIGAMVTLQVLLDFLITQPQEIQSNLAGLIEAIEKEATYNLRQIATIGGTIVAGDGRSALITILLAADTTLNVVSLNNYFQGEFIKIGDLLPNRSENLNGKLIIAVSIPSNTVLNYEYVARTPADLPIVCAASSIWASGRTRLAVGGYGEAPVLAFDGNDLEGVAEASRSAYSMAEDEWATKEYRSEVAGILTRRCLNLDGY